MREIKKYICRPLCYIFTALCVICLIYSEYIFEAPKLECNEGAYITLSGTVKEKNYDENQMLKSITVGDTLCYVNKVKTSDKNNLGEDGMLRLRLGQRITVSGTIHEFSSPMNFGAFDQKKYNEARGLYNYIYADTIAINSPASFENDNLLKKYYYAVRNYFEEYRLDFERTIDKTCPFESGTVKTLLLGDKTGLLEERKDLYQGAGVGHFLVISGLHISIIGACVYEIAKRIIKRRVPSCLLAVFCLFMYGLLVGFTVSVLRAVIMYGVRLFSFIFKRSYDMLSAVSLAGIITLATSPLMVADASFVYSYLTVIIIATYDTFFKQKEEKLGEYERQDVLFKSAIKIYIKPLFTIPVLLSVFMLPASLWFSYSYSALSVLVNAVLAPMSLPIMIFASGAAVTGISGLHKIAILADFLLSLLLRSLDKICGLSLETNAFVISGKPKIYAIIIFYALLISFWIYAKKNENNNGNNNGNINGGNRHIKIVFILSIICILFRGHYNGTEISMLYVGQGECVVVKTGHSSCSIFDMGSTSEKSIAKYTVIPFLKASGIRNVDGIFLSHSDADHVNGALEFIDGSKKNGIKVKKLYVQNLPNDYYDDALLEIIDFAKKEKVKVDYLKAGDRISKRGIGYLCLWPDKITNDLNSDSMAVLVTSKDINILFTGDITLATEKELIKHVDFGKIRINVLKIAHHGSKTASSDEFIKAVHPDVGLISAGINNRYNHPNKETIDVLIQNKIPFYCTKDSGLINVSHKRRGLLVQEYIKAYANKN